MPFGVTEGIGLRRRRLCGVAPVRRRASSGANERRCTGLVPTAAAPFPYRNSNNDSNDDCRRCQRPSELTSNCSESKLAATIRNDSWPAYNKGAKHIQYLLNISKKKIPVAIVWRPKGHAAGCRRHCYQLASLFPSFFAKKRNVAMSMRPTPRQQSSVNTTTILTEVTCHTTIILDPASKKNKEHKKLTNVKMNSRNS